ncbi:MAG: BON domain-containing protein [Pantoea sp. Brub]|nr:BON domain-containing protein [Pantoea sp. Brub]
MKIFKIASFLSMIIIFQSCIAFIINGGMLGVLLYSTKILAEDSHQSINKEDDNILRDCISITLSRNKQIKSNSNVHINVEVYGGEVLLTGQSPTIKIIQLVENLIKGINGISKIYNYIHIKNSITLIDKTKDLWISTKIRTRFLLHKPKIRMSHLKMITEDREIFFLGEVTKREADLIVNIAKQIHGVKKVYTIFHIKKS